MLAYSKESLAPVRDFIPMVCDLVREFDGEPGIQTARLLQRYTGDA